MPGRRLAILLCAVLAIFFFASAPNVVDAKGMAEPKLKGPFLPRAKEFEVTGEVVDAWCFTSQTMGPGRGESHKACAIACAAGGVTIGILDDQGNLYIAAKHKGYQGCKDLLLPFMGRRVHVVGWLAQAGGCNIMKINTVRIAHPGIPEPSSLKAGKAGSGGKMPPPAGSARPGSPPPAP